MNNLSSKSFFVFILIALFISTLFSQDSIPDRATDPVSIKDQFRHQFPEERFNPERPFSRSDFQHNHRPWLDTEGQIEGDYRRKFYPKRPSPPFMHNKQMLDYAWVNKWKYTYTDDTNGNRTEKLLQSWKNNTWENGEKYTYTYDTNGNRTEELYLYWDNNAWMNYRKYTYTYDANGNRTEELYLYWENNAWENREKYTFTYDANGNRTEWLWQIWGDPLAVIYGSTLPKEFKLSQNYPNPFNPVTTLHYDLPQRANVRLAIYDLLGGEIRTLVNRTEDPGYKSVIWDATNNAGQRVGAGIYLYRIQAGTYTKTNKMILLK